MSELGKLDHVDIVVDSPAEMAEFLEKLGFKQLRETGGGRGSIEMSFPGQGDLPFIELTPRRKPDGTTLALGLRHLAFRAPDLDAAYTKFSDAGMETDAPPRLIAQTGRRLFNLKDPEGNVVQVVDSGE